MQPSASLGGNTTFRWGQTAALNWVSTTWAATRPVGMLDKEGVSGEDRIPVCVMPEPSLMAQQQD